MTSYSYFDTCLYFQWGIKCVVLLYHFIFFYLKILIIFKCCARTLQTTPVYLFKSLYKRNPFDPNGTRSLGSTVASLILRSNASLQIMFIPLCCIFSIDYNSQQCNWHRVLNIIKQTTWTGYGVKLNYKKVLTRINYLWLARISDSPVKGFWCLFQQC